MIKLYRKHFLFALLLGFMLFTVQMAVAQVSISGGVAPTVCVGDAGYVTLSDIILDEISDADFDIQNTDQTIEIHVSAANRFEFEPGVGSVSFTGPGSGAVTASIIVTSTQITVTLSETDDTNADELNALIISGIKVRAINAAASLLLTRTGGGLPVNGFSVGTDIATSSLVSDAPPSAANAGADKTGVNAICGNTTTLDATSPANGTGEWSLVSNPDGLGDITDVFDPQSTFTGTPGLTYELQWTVSNGVCSPSTANVRIQFDAEPSIADAGDNQDVCGTITSLNATVPAVGTGQWSLISNPDGLGAIGNPNSSTSTFSGAAGSTYGLRWTVSHGVCPPSHEDVTIKFVQPPSTAQAGPNQSLCEAVSFTLAATVPAVGTGGWTVINGTATVTTPSSATSTVTGIPLGTSATLRWRVTNGACPASTSDVVLTNYEAIPDADAGLPSISQCNNSTFVMNASPATGLNTGSWSVVSGSATITNLNLPTTTVTGVAPGTSVTLRWTISNGGVCAATFDEITLTNYHQPSASVAGPDQSNCNSGDFVLAANPPAFGTGAWSIVGAPNGAVIDDVTSATSTVSGLTAGSSVTLRWTISNGVCTNSTSDVVLTNTLAAVVDAGSNVEICEGSVFNFSSQTVLASAVNYSSLLWESVGTPPTGILYNATTLTPTYQPGAGETGLLRFRLTAVGVGVCAPVSDIMEILITPRPVANAGSSEQVCEGVAVFDFASRSVLASMSNGTIAWTHNGTGSLNDATLLNPQYTIGAGDIGHDVTFVLTITSGSPTVCSTVQSQFTLTVNPRATVSIPDGDFSVCEPTIINLSGIIGGSAVSGSWNIVSGAGGTLSVSSITGNTVTATYTRLPSEFNTVLTFRLTANDPDGPGPCSFVTADVNVTVDESAKVDAGLDFQVCEYDHINLNATTGGATSTVTWSGGSGAAQFGDVNNPVTTYNLTTAERNATGVSFVFTLTTNDPPGVCPAVSDQVNVIVNDTLSFVNFFGLDPVYQEDDDHVELTGVPPGGVFIGPGIIGGTQTFVPEFAPLGYNNIVYIYTDPLTSCVSRVQKTTIVNPVTDITFDVYVSPPTLTVNPDALVPVPKIGGVPQVCATIREGDVLLYGHPDVLDDDASLTSPPVFTISPDAVGPAPSYIFKKANGQFYLNTKNLPPGDYTITYRFTNVPGAVSFFPLNIKVLAAPKSVIDVGNACVTENINFTESSLIPVNNAGNTAVLATWNWDFGNGASASTSSIPPAPQEPSYTYPQPGIYDVRLEVITNEGCRHDTLKTLRIGSKPEVKFAWSAFCNGNSTKFVDQSIVTVGDIAKYTWVFGDSYSVMSPYGVATVNNPIPPAESNGGRTSGTYAKPEHTYDNFQEYDVTLEIETSDGCVASLTRKAFILSYGTPTPTAGYFEDFESPGPSWFRTRVDDAIPTDTSWVLGVPFGAVINNSSGNAWWTGGNSNAVSDNSTYYNNEKSAVIGPCINLNNIKRPMISLDYWTDAESTRDGTVVQFSTDGGVTWQTIGDDGGAGIDWYKARGLTGDPGMQPLGQYGWSGRNTGWKTARYNLDQIPKAERDEVIFRIAFGSDERSTLPTGESTPYNGFAFDNVYIGEKKRTVMVEYFTNAGINQSTLNGYFDDMYDAQFSVLNKDSSDFFKLQYHIANPSADPINQQNPVDPAARSLYYGINLPPAAIMDGILGSYYNTTFNGNHQRITTQEIDRRALEDPLFDIKIQNLVADPAFPDSLRFDVDFIYTHPTQAFSTPVTFHVLLLEDRIDGSPIHRNVVRKFLLGTEGKTVNIPWTFNQTETVTVKTSIDVPIGENNPNLYLVAFVQDRRVNSKVIHQSVIVKAPERSGKLITGVDDPVLAQVKDIAIYPNPSTRYINFTTGATLTRNYQYSIVDQRGVTVLTGNLNNDLSIPQQVDLVNLADGVYIVMIHQNGRRLVQRKLVLLKR